MDVGFNKGVIRHYMSFTPHPALHSEGCHAEQSDEDNNPSELFFVHPSLRAFCFLNI